jgi:hypothetical protein
MFILAFVWGGYFIQIGDEYRRAKWIKNPVVRAIALLGTTNVVTRVLVVYVVIHRILAISMLYATLGPGIWGWLGETKTTALPLWTIQGALVAALMIELGLQFICQGRISRLLRKGALAVDAETQKMVLQRYLTELRRPYPQKLGRRILDAISELRMDDATVIAGLKSIADKYEFFVSPDDILQAVDRLDLRRRQKALQDGSRGAIASGA